MGHELEFGVFVTPDAGRADHVLDLAQVADASGLELFTVQDHPYQHRFLDAWMLLATVAAQTQRIRISANVTNLPLRPPAVLAKAIATLDVLNPGRVELGLGAGAFWDAIAAAGGPRRSPGEAVDALEEALTIIRQSWTGQPVTVRGEHYQVENLHPGPVPTGPVPIWLGAAKPRMLRLVGRAADAWIPSAAWAPPTELGAMNAVIDEAALRAGRQPSDVQRMYNLSTGPGSVLPGSPDTWPEVLADLVTTHGMSTFILPTNDQHLVQVWAAEVAPATRGLVARYRSQPRRMPATHSAAAADPAASPAGPRPLTVQPTPDSASLTAGSRLDESTRPTFAPSSSALDHDNTAQANAQHLVDIHDRLRHELAQVRDVLDQVERGALGVGPARSAINTMTMRQNNWTLGAYCESYCRLVTTHHTLEDVSVFPHLANNEPDLAPVLERLEQEHLVIHDVLEEFDRALVALVEGDAGTPRLEGVRHALDELTDTLLSHMAYEERELLEPLARYGYQ